MVVLERIVEATGGSTGRPGHRSTRNDTARYTIGWSYGGRLRVEPKLYCVFGFLVAVENVPDATGMRGRSNMSYVRSWRDRSGRGCATRTASVWCMSQLDGGHVQSGRSATGTDTFDGRKEAMVMYVRVPCVF
jgi:hypothetical protein